jgi:putative ABC transport system substrate-binding protein
MMNRRRFLQAVSVTLLATPVVAEAQPGGKPIRIGWLSSAPVERGRGPEDWRPGFERQLRQLGWEPRFELRYAGGEVERLADMAAELVHSKVDVIVATDTVAAQTAKRATTTLPIVFCGVADPVASGLVASLARPGANVTGGSSEFHDGIAGKWLELLREVRAVAKVGVVWNPATLTAIPRVREIERAAATFGVVVHQLAVSRSGDLSAVIEALRRKSVDGLIIDADLTLMRFNPPIIEAARTSRIPIVSPWRPMAETGGAVLAYGPSLPDVYRLAAVYVDKIARGAKPATLPVEQMAKYYLIVNLKTAKALGLTIPPSVLLRADHVIE